MKPDPSQVVYYKRSRFRTRLPADRSYVASHYWLAEEQPGLWRVGFTRFALRMMGDIVDCVFSANGRIELGESIGSAEGLKAISDIYSVVSGEFIAGNPEIDRNPALIDNDPYGEGWLYRARGVADESRFDVHGYAGVLDATIDKMLSERYKGAGGSDQS